MEPPVSSKSTVGFRRTWAEETAQVAKFTSPGPLVSAQEAREVTRNVVEAVEWASEKVTQFSTPLIPIDPVDPGALKTQFVDRVGLLHWLGEEGDKYFAAPWVVCPSGRYTPVALSATAWSLSTVAHRLHFGVSLSAPGNQAYCIPNVLQTAKKLELNQADLSKWLALRAQFWANLVRLLPWLQPYLARTLKTSGPSLQQALLLTLMLSAVVDAQMLQVQGSDIPSIHRIRTHIGRYDNVHVLETFPVQSFAKATRATKNQVAVFAKGLFREVPADRLLPLPEIFASAGDLPTIHELSNIEFWLERRGLV